MLSHFSFHGFLAPNPRRHCTPFPPHRLIALVRIRSVHLLQQAMGGSATSWIRSGVFSSLEDSGKSWKTIPCYSEGCLYTRVMLVHGGCTAVKGPRLEHS